MSKTTFDHKYNVGDALFTKLGSSVHECKVKTVNMSLTDGKSIISYTVTYSGLLGSVHGPVHEHELHESPNAAFGISTTVTVAVSTGRA